MNIIIRCLYYQHFRRGQNIKHLGQCFNLHNGWYYSDKTYDCVVANVVAQFIGPYINE